MEISWKVEAGTVLVVILLVWVVFKQREQIGMLKAGHHDTKEDKKTPAPAPKPASTFID